MSLFAIRELGTGRYWSAQEQWEPLLHDAELFRTPTHAQLRINHYGLAAEVVDFRLVEVNEL